MNIHIDLTQFQLGMIAGAGIILGAFAVVWLADHIIGKVTGLYR